MVCILLSNNDSSQAQLAKWAATAQQFFALLWVFRSMNRQALQHSCCNTGECAEAQDPGQK